MRTAQTDGKVLLFEESGIVGAELDVALGNIASCAVRYGYVKDDANVSVEVVSEKADDVFEKISQNRSIYSKKQKIAKNMKNGY